MLKRITTLFIVLAMLISVLPCKAQASRINLSEASFDKESATLKFAGAATGGRDAYIYASVTSANENAVSSDGLAASRQLLTVRELDSEGNFTGEIILPDSFPGGKFVLSVSYGDLKQNYYFSYISMNTLNSIASQITAGITSSQTADILDGYLDELLIESDYWESIKSTVCPIISGLCNSGYSGDRFYSTLTQSTGVYELKQGTLLSEVFELYLADILNYDSDFLALPSDVRAAVDSALRSAEYTKLDFATVYFNTVAVHTLKNASDYTQAQSYILNNNSRLNINLDKYNSETSYAKDVIMKTFFANVDDISEFSDIKKVFDDACTSSVSQKPASGSTPPGGTSSKPSSNPSSSVSFSPSAPSTPSVTEPIKPQIPVLSDVKNHWAEKAINTLCEKNVISGYEDGTFKPENNVTRAEFCKMVSSLLNGDYSGNVVFEDVKEGQWYYSYVTRLASAGIINGYGNVFNPDGNITREDAAVIISRMLSLIGVSAVGSVQFEDESHISDYAKSAVSSLADMGVINGYNNLFNPQNPLTRAEASTILCNIIDKIN